MSDDNATAHGVIASMERDFFGGGTYRDTFACQQCGNPLKIEFSRFGEEIRVDCSGCRMTTWFVSRLQFRRHNPLLGWNDRHPNFLLNGGDRFYIRVVDIDPYGTGLVAQ